MGKLIVEQIVSADGYAAEADGGIGFFESDVASIEAGTDISKLGDFARHAEGNHWLRVTEWLKAHPR